MFELMRQNELTPPEFASTLNSFSVTLHHKTIYTEKQRLWLDQFETYSLTREQKAIVVLGIGEKLISMQDIWDSLGIVDTEHYRQLVDSLQRLSLLHSVIRKRAAQVEAKQRGIPVRRIARFKVAVRRSKVVQRGATGEGGRSTDSAVTDSPDPNAELWIGNLPFVVSNRAVLEFLSQFGEVQNLRIPRVIAGNNTKGYGFVEFENPKSVEELLVALNGREFQGKRLVVRKALAPSSRLTRQPRSRRMGRSATGTRVPPKV